jgi:hypothetical protein
VNVIPAKVVPAKVVRDTAEPVREDIRKPAKLIAVADKYKKQQR